jgi:hypothetical protein
VNGLTGLQLQRLFQGNLRTKVIDGVCCFHSFEV